MPRYILETTEALDEMQCRSVAAIVNYFSHLECTVKPQSRSLHIVGRRWFQRTYGNTYNTAEIQIDGRTVHRTPMQYGYGDHFLTIAHEWLVQSGHLPERPVRASGSRGYGDTIYLREESGFDFTYEVHDVQRQKDL